MIGFLHIMKMVIAYIKLPLRSSGVNGNVKLQTYKDQYVSCPHYAVMTYYKPCVHFAETLIKLGLVSCPTWYKGPRVMLFCRGVANTAYDLYDLQIRLVNAS